MSTPILLTFLSPLSSLEKLLFLALFAGVFILFFDIFKKKYIKKRRAKMLKQIVYIKQNKWEDLIDILTSPNTLQCHEIKNRLQIDLSVFDSKYRNIFYHELFKIKKEHDVNPDNWKLLVGIIYNGTSKVK